MNTVKKKETEGLNSYLNEYIEHCPARDKREFMIVLLPMLFQQNNHTLDVRVGKKLSRNSFQVFLGSSIKNFNITLSKFKEDIILTFRGFHLHDTYFSLNLAAVNNVHFNSSEINSSTHRYKVDFNYNNEIDYQLDFVI